MWEDTGDEEGLCRGEKPDETSIYTDLVVYQSLDLWRGCPELFRRDQHHLAEVGRGRPGLIGPVAAHNLHA